MVVCETIPTTNIITRFGSWKEETAPILPRSHKNSNGAVIASEAKHPHEYHHSVRILQRGYCANSARVSQKLKWNCHCEQSEAPPTSIITRFGSWKEETAPILPGSHITQMELSLRAKRSTPHEYHRWVPIPAHIRITAKAHSQKPVILSCNLPRTA